MNDYIVVCLDNGIYTLATQDDFPTRNEAEQYAATVDPSQLPLVIAGRFSRLHFLAPLGAQRQAQLDEAAGNLPTSRETVLTYITNPREQRMRHSPAPTKQEAESLLDRHKALLDHAIKQGWCASYTAREILAGRRVDG